MAFSASDIGDPPRHIFELLNLAIQLGLYSQQYQHVIRSAGVFAVTNSGPLTFRSVPFIFLNAKYTRPTEDVHGTMRWREGSLESFWFGKERKGVRKIHPCKARLQP